MPSDFASAFQAALQSQAPAPASEAPSEASPTPAQEAPPAPEAEGTGDPAPQQDEGHDEQEQQEEQQDEEGQPEDQEENQRGDLNKALASERYRARQAREALKATQAELAQLREQAAQVQTLQAQMQQLQAERQQATQASAQAEAEALAQAYAEQGDHQSAMRVMQEYAQSQIEAAKAQARAQAEAAQAQALEAQALARIQADVARLRATHGEAYDKALAWATGAQSPLAPVMQALNGALLNGQMTPEGLFQLAHQLQRGASTDDAAIEAEVQRRLAAKQVEAQTGQQGRPTRLGALPGGTGNTSHQPAQRGNPGALQQMQRGSGFGAYFQAATQAQG